MFALPKLRRASMQSMTLCVSLRNISKKSKVFAKPVADKIKDNNLESKMLFGKVISKADKAKVPARIDEKPMSSEIYWQTQHEPLADFSKTKKSSAKKATKKVIAESNSTKKKPKKKAAVKVDTSVKTNNPFVVESLETFNNSLLPFKPVIEKKKLIKPAKIIEERIPFDSTNLKRLLNFPLRPEENNLFSKLEHVDHKIALRPSVSKILQATMSESSRNALIQWKSLKIGELGLEGFEQLQKSHLDKGKKFHYCLEKYFETGAEHQESINQVPELWKSVFPAIGDITKPAKLIEVKLWHPYLYYQGVIDCVSTINNNVFAIEWKKSDSPKPKLSSTYDAPLQLCAYIGALNYDEQYKHLDIRNGVIVVGYSSGQKADVHYMDEAELKKNWRLWLLRLQEFWIRYRDKTLPEPI